MGFFLLVKHWLPLQTRWWSISWRTRKQITVALSSTEAEYLTATDTFKQAIHHRNFLKEIGLSAWSDHRACGQPRCNCFVRESVQARTVNSEYICLSSSAPRVHSPLVPGVPFYALPHSVYSFILCVLLHHQFNFNLGLVGDTQHLLLID